MYTCVQTLTFALFLLLIYIFQISLFLSFCLFLCLSLFLFALSASSPSFLCPPLFLPLTNFWILSFSCPICSHHFSAPTNTKASNIHSTPFHPSPHHLTSVFYSCFSFHYYPSESSPTPLRSSPFPSTSSVSSSSNHRLIFPYVNFSSLFSRFLAPSPSFLISFSASLSLLLFLYFLS